MDRPLVSIVIVNFNGKRFLKECLSAVFGSKYPNFEVILVDNASTDGSVDLVLCLFAKNVRLKIVKNVKNLGFGSANNIGISQAKGDYIVFLNNDTSVKPDWLTSLVDAVENDLTIGLASSLVLNVDGRTVQTAGILKCDYMLPGYLIEMGKDGSKIELPKVFEISVAIGASMIARRKFLNQIGAFDPKYFHYYDDDFLSFKTWIAGKRVVTVSESKVRHYSGGTSGSVSNNFFRYRHSFIGSTSLIIDVYLNLLDLTKGLFIFFVNRVIYDSLFNRKIISFWGSMAGALWVIRNLKYVWRNRLKYWRKAVIDERTLRSKLIRIKLPTSVYLVPRLFSLFFNNETEKYRKNLSLQAKSARMPLDIP